MRECEQYGKAEETRNAGVSKHGNLRRSNPAEIKGKEQ
jgi:hypothetical protein